MDVYEYSKSLLVRLEEAMDVLDSDDGQVAASQINVKWAYFIDCQVEPCGWQAIWRIPRAICEGLKISYPTTVYGSVEQVLFKDLKAVFSIIAVEDETDDVELPVRHEVNLIDLWATKTQQHEEINVENTADCIDKLRFFYNHIWMPWDNDCDDDVNWTQKRLESRIRFYYDMQRKDMKRALSARIRTLITEARYIQSRREYLEIGLSDDEGEMDENFDKTQITDLMRLHLRLNMIKSELEMLENPEMRKIYEEMMFDSEKYLKHALLPEKKMRYSGSFKRPKVYLVTKPYSFSDQLKYMEVAKKFIADETIMQMCPSLQNVLDFCDASDQIYLPPGPHFMKFLEYLNDKGLICGLTPEIHYNNRDRFDSVPDVQDVVIMSQDDYSIVIIFDGDFTLQNLTIDCRNTRLGILVKNGKVEMKNCLVIGNEESTTQEGIVVSGNGELHLEDCLIKNFSIGMALRDDAEVTVKSSTILNCIDGIVMEDDTNVYFVSAVIMNGKRNGINFATNCMNNKVEKRTNIYNGLYEMKDDLCEDLPWSGDCKFENNRQNIIVINKHVGLLSQHVSKLLSDSMENVRYSSFQKSESDSNSDTSMDSDIICVDDPSIIEID